MLVPHGLDSRSFWDGVEMWRKKGEAALPSDEEDLK
jgi:hypothetical protein